MSRSFRTRPKDIIARDRMPRDRRGNTVFPRIIVRKPKLGDCHPLDRRMIAAAFEKLPLEYFYGLKQIELRARQGDIGKPFGKYSYHSKTITLYSVPGKLWRIKDISEGWIEALQRYHAEIHGCEGGNVIEWGDSVSLSMFCLSTLFHELGHHYLHQYKGKKKPPRGLGLNEWHADAQIIKLQKHAFHRRID